MKTEKVWFTICRYYEELHLASVPQSRIEFCAALNSSSWIKTQVSFFCIRLNHVNYTVNIINNLVALPFISHPLKWWPQRDYSLTISHALFAIFKSRWRTFFSYTKDSTLTKTVELLSSLVLAKLGHCNSSLTVFTFAIRFINFD